MAEDKPKKHYKSTGQTKIRYQITDQTGTTEWLNLRQVCRYFGFKYTCMYDRVVKKGMDIEAAVEDCRTNPYTWGM